MLRSSFTCATPDEVLFSLNTLTENNKVKILRIKSRFGAANNNLNDVVINYDY